MWKIVAGFVVFAALSFFVLMKGGEIDLSGEKHGIETTDHAPEPAAAAASAAK